MRKNQCMCITRIYIYSSYNMYSFYSDVLQCMSRRNCAAAPFRRPTHGQSEHARVCVREREKITAEDH